MHTGDKFLNKLELTQKLKSRRYLPPATQRNLNLKEYYCPYCKKNNHKGQCKTAKHGVPAL